ncbi:ABC transporter permease [Mangrovibrevibacter kandeliae]|uniref:ABC transporter permease n=1 Tax=Mangrovibrevibacter kandeliae TaxID=2968473 RepID=UPI0021184659|nr:ABC transporter permease [Aurantimonas sp. CSK15Z-1]MCQ8782254.1 ABC transporter permease [Aurantimonas sp. CSK15Z-1]
MRSILIAGIAALLAAPVLIGLAGVVLPAVGYFPALGGDALSLQPFRDLLAVPGIIPSALLSLATGLAATLLSVLVVVGFCAASWGTASFAAMRRLLAPLLAIPHAAAALGLALLIAPSGPLFRLAALPLGLDRPPDLLVVGDPLGLSLTAGLVAKEAPFLLLVALAALPQAKPARRLRLARALGYGRVVAFLLTVWPTVYRQIRLPVLAVLAFASSVVDVALILGPSTPPTLAVRLVGWMNDPDLSLRFLASAAALLQLGVTLAAVLLWLGVERVGTRLLRAAIHGGRRGTADRVVRQVLPLPFRLGALALGLGTAMLLVWSFAGYWPFPSLLPSLSMHNWMRAAASAGPPLRTTLLVAAMATFVALVLVVALLKAIRARGGPMVETKTHLPPALLAAVYLPLIVPQVAFLSGLQIAIIALGWTPGLPLLVAAHLVFVAPYLLLSLADPWFALDPRYERIGASLGRSRPALFLRLRLPLLLAPLLTACAIGFAVSVGQYLPTLLIGAGRLPTITTEAVALAAGGNRGLTAAYALLQTALPCLVFALALALPALRHRRRRGMKPA